MDFKNLANLEEVKMMARGNLKKLAEYNVKRAEFEQVKSQHFSEENPFVDSFSESYIEELKQFAKENPDDESAQIRYALQKERYAVQEGKKTAHIDLRIARSVLQNKLASGEKISNGDLALAEKLTRQNPALENLVVYSQIKRQLDEGEM